MEKHEMILKLIDYYCNGNKSQFANMLNVKPQTINSWITRNTFDTELIYANCKQVSAEWLITGEGSMLKKDGIPEELVYTDPARSINYKPKTHPTGNLNNEKTVSKLAETRKMDASIEMTEKADNDRFTWEHNGETYVIPAFRGADSLVTVTGDSMFPTYRNGDMVACRTVPKSDCFFQWNRIYVVDTNQGRMVRRIKPSNDKETILLVSDNQEYDPIEIAIQAIHQIALIVGVIRME